MPHGKSLGCSRRVAWSHHHPDADEPHARILGIQLPVPRAREMGRLDAYRHGRARIPVLHRRCHAAVTRTSLSQRRHAWSPAAPRSVAGSAAGRHWAVPESLSALRLRHFPDSGRPATHRLVLHAHRRVHAPDGAHRRHAPAVSFQTTGRGRGRRARQLLAAALLRAGAGIRSAALRSCRKLAGRDRSRRHRRATFLPALARGRQGGVRPGRNPVDLAVLLQRAAGRARGPHLYARNDGAARDSVSSPPAP